MIKIKCRELVDFAIAAEIFYDNLALTAKDEKMPRLAHKAERFKKELRNFRWEAVLTIDEMTD